MTRRSKSVILTLLVVLVLFLFVPSVNAVNYDIGRVSSSGNDVDWYLYDSGSSIKLSNDKYLDYLHLILDGNESTGLNHNFGADSSAFNVIIHFPFSIFVNNITVKPVFNGSASSYNLFIDNNHFGVALASGENLEKKYDINVKLNSMQITIDNGGTNHFYFNDILIDYNIIPASLDEVIESITILTKTIENMTNEYNDIRNDLETINNYLYNADDQLFANITKLWNSFNMLNQSITYLAQQLQQLNITVYGNITSIENDVHSLKKDISNLYETIQNLIDAEDGDDLSGIWDQLNDTASDINNIYDNITLIRKNILEGLDDDDQSLIDRIFELESENTILKCEIENLTKRMNAIKETEKETVIKEDDGDNTILYGALGLGLIAIIIAIISLMIKRKQSVEDEDEKKEEGLQEPQVQSVTQLPFAPPAPEIPKAPEAAIVKPAVAEQVQENNDEKEILDT